MAKIDGKLKVSSSILLLLFIFSSFSLFFIPQAYDNLSRGFSGKLKLSTSHWTTTEVVSTESTEDSSYPAIALDVAGVAYVVWYDSTNYDNSGTDIDIFFKIRNCSWTQTEVVSKESTSDSLFPTIAVDTTGNAHVAWHDFTNNFSAGADLDIFYKRWDTVSKTWTMTEVVSTESVNNSGYPTIAVDDAVNVYLAWADQTDYGGAGIDDDIFFKLWNATSSTWTTVEVVSTESTNTSSTPSISMDGAGNVHVAWTDWTDYGGAGIDADIFYKLWNATSDIWTPTEVVSTESANYSADPTIAVDGAGNVHVAWFDYTNYDGSGTDFDIFYKQWNATSRTWNPAEVVSTESARNSFDPTIAVDSDGNAHVAWEDYMNDDGSDTDPDIFYKLWDATSSTWNPIEVVSTESMAGSGNPTIAVHGVDNVHVAWGDISNHSQATLGSDIFYKQTNPLCGFSEPSEPGISGYNIFLLIGIICVVSVILFKKRNKNIL